MVKPGSRDSMSAIFSMKPQSRDKIADMLSGDRVMTTLSHFKWLKLTWRNHDDLSECVDKKPSVYKSMLGLQVNRCSAKIKR